MLSQSSRFVSDLFLRLVHISDISVIIAIVSEVKKNLAASRLVFAASRLSHEEKNQEKPLGPRYASTFVRRLFYRFRMAAAILVCSICIAKTDDEQLDWFVPCAHVDLVHTGS